MRAALFESHGSPCENSEVRAGVMPIRRSIQEPAKGALGSMSPRCWPISLVWPVCSLMTRRCGWWEART